MNMMDGIAATASSLASAQLQQSYTLAVSKKAMESQELAVQELLQMLPPSSSSGYQSDVYASAKAGMDTLRRVSMPAFYYKCL